MGGGLSRVPVGVGGLSRVPVNSDFCYVTDMVVPSLAVLASIAHLEARGDDPVTYVQKIARGYMQRLRIRMAYQRDTRLLRRINEIDRNNMYYNNHALYYAWLFHAVRNASLPRGGFNQLYGESHPVLYMSPAGLHLPGEEFYNRLNFPSFVILPTRTIEINWLNILTRLRIWIRRFKTRQARFEIASEIARREGFEPPMESDRLFNLRHADYATYRYAYRAAERLFARDLGGIGYKRARASFGKRAREQLDIRNVGEFKVDYIVNRVEEFIDNFKRQRR